MITLYLLNKNVLLNMWLNRNLFYIITQFNISAKRYDVKEDTCNISIYLKKKFSFLKNMFH